MLRGFRNPPFGKHRPGPRILGQTPPPAEPNVRDVYGRILAEGDRINLNVAVPPLFVVTKIEPFDDPTAPPNMMMITVSTTLPFAAPADQINTEFTRVLTKAEVEEKQAEVEANRPSGLVTP